MCAYVYHNVRTEKEGISSKNAEYKKCIQLAYMWPSSWNKLQKEHLLTKYDCFFDDLLVPMNQC